MASSLDFVYTAIVPSSGSFSESHETRQVKVMFEKKIMAYKPIDEIVSEMGPTADIIERIRPFYNFKAAE